MKYFYTEIIDIESLIVELDKMDLKDHHKKDLAKLIDSITHQTILEVVFSALPKQDHAPFIDKLKTGASQIEVIDFLKGRVDNIDELILKAWEQLKIELHKDIKAAQNISDKY